MNKIQEQQTDPHSVNTNDMPFLGHVVTEVRISNSDANAPHEMDGGNLIPPSRSAMQSYLDEVRRESNFRCRATLDEANAIISKLRRIYPELTDEALDTTTDLPEPVSSAGYRFLMFEEQLEQGDEFSSDGMNWVGTHYSGQTVQMLEVGRYRRQLKAEATDSKSEHEITNSTAPEK